MAAKRETGKSSGDELMGRLQKMLYDFHDLGHFDDARPHILWLMEIAQTVESGPSAVPLSPN